MQAGVLFGDLEGGGDGGEAEAAVLGAEEVVGGGAGEGQGHALLAGDLDGERDILGGPLKEEGGVVVVALEQLGHGAQMCAGGGDAHDLVGALWVEAGFAGQHGGLHQHLRTGDPDHVVDDLGQRAHAQFAHVEDVVADALEDGLVLVEGGAIAADHHGEFGALSAIDAVGDGGVEHGDALLRCPGGKAADRGGEVGGEVEADGAGSGAGEDAVGAEQDGFEFGRAGQRGEDHLALGGDGGGGLGPGCAELDQVGGVLLDEIVDDDAVAALDDVGAHGVADVAGADEADVHG